MYKNHKFNCQCIFCKRKRGEYPSQNKGKYIDIISKELLIKEYIQNKKSIYQIAKQIDCGSTTIFSYLKKYNIKLRNISGKNNPNFKHGESCKDKKHYCIEKGCGKEIGWRAKRCGSCAIKELLKNPKNHPNYIDGRSKEPYPLEWNLELKESIRKRDNYECQCCGMTEEEHLIVIGTVLNIHHIDYNKKNCKEENLITTCFWCNLRANNNRNYWKDFYKIKVKEIIKQRNNNV
jgi:hypothetical protein